MQVICIDDKPNTKDCDHLKYGQYYTVTKTYTSTLLDPSLEFVRETFFLVSLPDTPPKRYNSKRFKEIESVKAKRDDEARKEMEMRIIEKNKKKKWSSYV